MATGKRTRAAVRNGRRQAPEPSTQKRSGRSGSRSASPAAASPPHPARVGDRTGPGSRVAGAVPKLIAFDLDGTLWWPEMYMLSGKPFRRGDGGRLVIDGRGERVRLMGASHDIMHELVTTDHFRGTKVLRPDPTAQGAQPGVPAAADVPAWADACLKLFEAAPGVPLQQAAHYSEIYPGTKTRHFRAVHKASDIAYRDMLFFDNEHRNVRDCAALGITAVYTPDGMTRQVWEAGLAKHARAVAARCPQQGGAAQHDGPRTAGLSSADDSDDGDDWGGYWT